jgi:hypothetical protein
VRQGRGEKAARKEIHSRAVNGWAAFPCKRMRMHLPADSQSAFAQTAAGLGGASPRAIFLLLGSW